jgi:hypothetical protein
MGASSSTGGRPITQTMKQAAPAAIGRSAVTVVAGT